ncbi:MAG: glycosyltransferase family 2 protein [Planctomycetota bacterium]
MSASTLPSVSVAMPMRNAAAFVAESVRSVLSQATPTYAVQLVVVDDGSSDGSADVVRAVLDEQTWPNATCEILTGPCNGIAAALNAAFAACTGTYLARCDSDDLFPPGRLARHAAFLEDPANAEFVAVCGGFDTVDPKGALVSRLHEDCESEDITDKLRRGDTPTHFGTFLVRRTVVEALGGARDYFAGTEDVDLQLRIGTIGRVWFEPDTAYIYRLHHASSTHTQASPVREFLTEQARKFARQRAEGKPDDLARGVAEAPPTDDATTPGGKPMDVGEQIQGMLIGRSWKAVAAGQRSESFRLGWAAIKARPIHPAGYTNLLKLLILPTLRHKTTAPISSSR